MLVRVGGDRRAQVVLYRAELFEHAFDRRQRNAVENGLHHVGAEIGQACEQGYEQRELEEMVAAGVSPAQVIVAATSRSAEYLGLRNMGTLAPGKRADFIVLYGNPLGDIRQTRSIESVYFDGRPIDRAMLRGRLTRD